MTKFINPNNPLRKVASKGPAGVKPAQVPVINKFASKRDEQNFEAQGAQGVLNPKRFAGFTQEGSKKVAQVSNERMYNAAGELNASDNRDAIAQLGHLFSITPGIKRQASLETKESVRKILAAAMQSEDGRQLVGQELAMPIKAIIDGEGFIRKVYRVRTLQQGELFRINKDVRATAYCVSGDGQSLVSQAIGQYIIPDESLISSYPEVSLQDIYQMNYDVLDRMQDTARQEIEAEEDKRGILVLDAAAQAVNAVSTFTNVSLSVFENLRFQVEQHRLIVDKFLLNRQELSGIEINMSGSVDMVTQREWNLSGYVGNWLGAHFIISAGTGVEEIIPAGTIYAVTAPEYLGEMGIRMELFSQPYNLINQKRAVKGFAFLEMVGFGMPSAKPVAKAMLG